MIALYMRLSGADGDLDGDKAESNSISNQRKILRDFVRRDPVLSACEVEEFVDDGFSGSNFDRPDVQRMLEMCREGLIDTIVVKDLSRFAREEIDSGTYIEQVFPFLRIRFISLGEGIDTLHADMDCIAPDIAIRNIANAAYCLDTSIRMKSTLRTKWRRGLRPHAMPPFGYMVDPDDPMKLAIDERTAPTVRRAYELAAQGMSAMDVAEKMNEEGYKIPGVTYRNLGLYGFDKRPEPKRRKWTGTIVASIVRDPVNKGTLVAGKTRRKVMSKGPYEVVPDEERYVTEGAHPAIVSAEQWEKAQVNLVTRDRSKGIKHSEPASPFAKGLLRRAECGHSLNMRRRLASDNFFVCACDCAGGEARKVTDSQVADAIAAALKGAGDSKAGPVPAAGPGHADGPGGTKQGAPKRRRSAVTPSMRLEAYERYVSGRATLQVLRALGEPEEEPARSLRMGPAERFMAEGTGTGMPELVSALEEHRFDDVDRKLLRRVVDHVAVGEGGRIEVVLARR